MYCPPGNAAPLALFLPAVGDKLTVKLVRQIFLLADTPPQLWREPHVKHFSIEKYSPFYELREKNKILVRVIFTICDGDILLLAPFVKRHKRDTMRALEQSIHMLAKIRANPECAVKFALREVISETA